jgi:hypothetical protein
MSHRQDGEISAKIPLFEAERAASYIIYMAVYLARTCPMCRNFFGVTIAKANGSGYRPIHGRCATCGYEIAWALISS